MSFRSMETSFRTGRSDSEMSSKIILSDRCQMYCFIVGKPENGECVAKMSCPIVIPMLQNVRLPG